MTGSLRAERNLGSAWPDDFADAAGRELLERAVAEERGSSPVPGPLRVAYYATHLGAGGVSRSLVNIATAASRRRAVVEVLIRRPLFGASAHFVPELRRQAIACDVVPAPGPPRELSRGDLLESLPPSLARALRRTAHRLARSTPPLLHCFQGVTSVLGGLAGIVVGVSGILLSVLSPQPGQATHAWQRGWYRLLARSPRVALVGDSEACVRGHSEWLDLPETRFQMIPSVFDGSSFPRPSAEQRAAFRSGLGIPPEAPLIVGGFRLQPVKRPLDFVEAVAALRREVPEVHAVIAGVGDLEPELRARIAALGLDGALRLLGARSDVDVLLGSSDICLHTSEAEGAPMILIEAQWLGVPVVAASVGGVPQTVMDGRSGFLRPLGDVKALAESCARLLRDPELRSRMGREGRANVAERFEAAKVLPRWWSLYAGLSGDARWSDRQ